MHVFRHVRVGLLAMALAIPAAGLASSGVLAYGAADQPLAQVEISGNCNDPSFFFCSHVVGLGGIWVWVEIDANGTGDAAGSNCDRSNGATSLREEITWFYATGAEVAQLGVGHPGIVDPTNTYYVIPELHFAVPVTQGHYSSHPVAAVTLQIQVAP